MAELIARNHFIQVQNGVGDQNQIAIDVRVKVFQNDDLFGPSRLERGEEQTALDLGVQIGAALGLHSSGQGPGGIEEYGVVEQVERLQWCIGTNAADRAKFATGRIEGDKAGIGSAAPDKRIDGAT